MNTLISGDNFKVWATMRSPDQAEAFPELKNLKTLALDVSSEQSISDAIDHIIAEDGHIDILINNAGYGTWYYSNKYT